MLIMAVDPGGDTGWATFEYSVSETGLVWYPDIAKHFTEYGELGEEDHHYVLKQLLGSKMPNITICERFEHRNNEFAQLISCEYIGICKLFAQQKHRTLVMQGASQAVVWCDDRKLKHLGLWIPGTPHAMDARRHLVYFLAHGHKSPMVRRHILNELRGLK